MWLAVFPRSCEKWSAEYSWNKAAWHSHLMHPAPCSRQGLHRGWHRDSSLFPVMTCMLEPLMYLSSTLGLCPEVKERWQAPLNPLLTLLTPSHLSAASPLRRDASTSLRRRAAAAGGRFVATGVAPWHLLPCHNRVETPWHLLPCDNCVCGWPHAPTTWGWQCCQGNEASTWPPWGGVPQGAKICEKLPVLPLGRLRKGVLMDIPGLNEAWEACEVCLPEYKPSSLRRGCPWAGQMPCMPWRVKDRSKK